MTSGVPSQACSQGGTLDRTGYTPRTGHVAGAGLSCVIRSMYRIKIITAAGCNQTSAINVIMTFFGNNTLASLKNRSNHLLNFDLK